MALGDVIARLAVSLSLETAAFEKGATQLEKRHAQLTKNFEKWGKKVTDIGKSMSVAVTLPIAAFGYTAVKAAQESAEAMGQVDAALKSMGDGAGRTREQLAALASSQMRTSLFDDDEILRKVTANLLTFGNVAGDQFDRAQQAAIDLSARMGTDLQSSALMLGKALNDPAKGLAALRRVGIQFTEQQQEQIKKMAEAGDAAGAQSIMLAELERQFSGSAQAMRDADPMAAAKMNWAEFQETVGEKLLPILPVLADAIIKVLDAFSGLSPEMQQVVIIGAAVVAAVGPVLTLFGSLVTVGAPLIAFLAQLGPVISIVSKALLLIALNPAVLAFAGVVAGIYFAWKYWDKIEPIVKRLYTAVKTWVLDRLGAVWDWVVEKLSWVGKAFYALYDAVVGHSYIPDMVDGIAQHMARLQSVMVIPVQKGAQAAADAMRQMATDIEGLLGRLFPASAALAQFRKEMALLERARAAGPGKGGIDQDTFEAARRALEMDYMTDGAERSTPDFLKDVRPLDEGVDKVLDSIGRMGKQTEVVNTRIVKSFADMAQATLSSLNSLASSIKGGGFLDILSSVLGLVTQLGSIGAFGKTVADRINTPKVPAYAGGTNYHPGGLALVGERGPELVNMPRGSSVTPNGQWQAPPMRVEIVPSEYFNAVVDGRVQQAAGPIMIGGANVAQARAQRAQSRRVA